MMKSRYSPRVLALGMIPVLLAVVVLVYLVIREPNASNRARISSILLSSSTPQQQLNELLPYVKLGDHIATVDPKVSAQPEGMMSVSRPTEHAYGLRDVNLVLAIRANGRVVGIGRHKIGVDDGTVWLLPPDWSGT